MDTIADNIGGILSHLGGLRAPCAFVLALASLACSGGGTNGGAGAGGTTGSAGAGGAGATTGAAGTGGIGGAGGTTGAGGRGGGAGAGGSSATCAGGGFSTSAITWPTPSGQFAYALDYGGTCGMNRYGTIDMNGDQRPDLVVTNDCVSGSSLGQDHWQVHLNTGSGFAASAVSWTLPPGGFIYGLAYGGTCGTTRYGTVDMNGDQRPDLVVTSDCVTGSSLGQDRWQVHLNTGSGFAASAVSWTLPAGGYVYGLGYGATCGTTRYGTVDMNGDQKPDLVVTSDCTSGSSVGVDRWLVYLSACP